MVLGKLPVPGHPTNLGQGQGLYGCCLDIGSLVYHFFSFSFSLRLTYCLKGPLNQKHNQPNEAFYVTCTLLLNRVSPEKRFALLGDINYFRS